MAGVVNSFFFGLDDRDLILRNLIDILQPSACGIFRSDLSSTLQHCSREEGEKTEPDCNAVEAVVRLLPPYCWVTAILADSVAEALCLK